MRKLSTRMAALALTLPLITTTFASCGERSDISYSNYKNDSAVYEGIESDGTYRPEYENNSEEYHDFGETGFKDPKTEPLSTFSADVDTAS